MRRMTMLAGWFVWKGLRVEKSQRALPPQIRAWVEARKRHRLSHAQVQMARELGLNPGKLGKLSNHGQEPWKAPLAMVWATFNVSAPATTRSELLAKVTAWSVLAAPKM